MSGSLRADSVGDGVAGGGGGGGGGSGGLVVPRVGGHTLPIREKSMDLGDRQRTEARRRLLQTRRTASFRQNSATESADSIEIYIPEAQTRLWTPSWGVSLPPSHPPSPPAKLANLSLSPSPVLDPHAVNALLPSSISIEISYHTH